MTASLRWLPTSRLPVAASEFLDRDPERTLLAAAQRGDARAREQLVRSHLRLVVGIARKHAAGAEALEDRVHEGVLGLLEAVERFDLSRDVRFSTYATYWIRERIRAQATEERHMVGAPSTRAARIVLRRHRRARKALEQRLGRAPTRDELADELGVRSEDVAGCEASLGGSDRPIGADDGTGTYLEPACSAPDPESRVGDAEQVAYDRARIARALERLSVRERMIVEERFLAEEPTHLGELGSRLGISRERARQLQEGARSKLRASLETSVRDGSRC